MKRYIDTLTNSFWDFNDDVENPLSLPNVPQTLVPFTNDYPLPVITPAPPTSVSMRQARLALFQQGKLSQVQPLIDAMTEPAKTETQISWDYATTVQRDDDMVVQLAAAMGLTSADLDALFTLAATL